MFLGNKRYSQLTRFQQKNKKLRVCLLIVFPCSLSTVTDTTIHQLSEAVKCLSAQVNYVARVGWLILYLLANAVFAFLSIYSAKYAISVDGFNSFPYCPTNSKYSIIECMYATKWATPNTITGSLTWIPD